MAAFSCSSHIFFVTAPVVPRFAHPRHQCRDPMRFALSTSGSPARKHLRPAEASETKIFCIRHLVFAGWLKYNNVPWDFMGYHLSQVLLVFMGVLFLLIVFEAYSVLSNHNRKVWFPKPTVLSESPSQ
jgi:hypothetical protein